jgi:hypothetical protein
MQEEAEDHIIWTATKGSLLPIISHSMTAGKLWCLISAPFRETTQRIAVIPYRRCAAAYRVSSSKFKNFIYPWRWYPIGCPTTSVERSSHLLCGGNLGSLRLFRFPVGLWDRNNKRIALWCCPAWPSVTKVGLASEASEEILNTNKSRGLFTLVTII